MDTVKFSRSDLHKFADLPITLLAFLLVHALYFGDLQLVPVRMLVLLFAIGAAYAVFTLGGMYSSAYNHRLGEELSRLTVCFALIVLITGLFAFLSKIAVDVSRLWFATSMLLSYVICGFSRVMHRFYMARQHRKGVWSRSIVIAGSGGLALFTLNRISGPPWTGIKVDGIFDDLLREGSGELTLSGRLEDIIGHVEARRRSGKPIDQVWVTLPLKEEESIQRLMEALKDSSSDICIVPNLTGSQLLAGTKIQLAGLSVVNISEVHLAPLGELIKTAFDYVTALVAVIVLAPIMLTIAILIRLDSPGNVLFKQRRYGIDGQEIEVWKFRSMSVEEDGHDVAQAKKNDVRVTKLGRVLRRTSLDELPQFFNVLQGRMSVVGPRPHAVAHNEEYRSKIQGYMMRHKIKPGITGLAQVKGWRGETDTMEKMEQRVRYDLEYIKNWSLWLDVKIVLLTIVRGFNDKGVY